MIIITTIIIIIIIIKAKRFVERHEVVNCRGA